MGGSVAYVLGAASVVVLEITAAPSFVWWLAGVGLGALIYLCDEVA